MSALNPDLLLQHFERISEAPDAIPRLRRFILDLAVRGKLVAQDPNDASASELLKRVQQDKARRVRVGEIRNPRSLGLNEGIDALFPLPESWVWLCLADVGAIVGGGTPPSGDPDNFTTGGTGVAWLTPADLGQHTELYVSHGARDLTVKGLKSSSATIMPKGTVLFTSRAPIGYTAIAANEITTNQGFKSVVPYVAECSRYIAVYLRAFGPWIEAKAPGTTFKEVSGKIVAKLPFPLPPLAEQHRIVAKVDELMALCDELDAAKTKRESRRDRLVTVSLHRLSIPSDANEGKAAETFRDHARFVFDNLPKLTTRPEHIKQLRQTILSLAVRGKLVAQDPNDTSAKQTLISLASKKHRAKSDITGRDWLKMCSTPLTQAFEPPAGWAWCRIGETVERVTVGFVGTMKDQYVPTGIPFLRSQNVRANRFRPEGLAYITPDFHRKIFKSSLAPGDVVVVRSGNVGTSCVIPTHIADGNCSDLVIIKKPLATIPEYLCFYLNSLASVHIIEGSVGVALTHFNTKSVATMPIPLPPLAEQRRIVAKVDELMALCDQLESQLTTKETDSRRLLEAVLHEALKEAADA